MLAISEEFTSFQGEGMMAGTKMYFVRTQGCNVGCHFCDTKYTWKKEQQTTDEMDIVARAKASGVKWVCITGGEPLEQDLGILIVYLKANGFKVQVETSGMYYRSFLKNIDWVTVSPKNLFAKKGIDFSRAVMPFCNELKCVVTCDKDIDFYLDFFRNLGADVDYKIFQPVDNSPDIANLLLKRKDIGEWKVRCQEQKLLNLR